MQSISRRAFLLYFSVLVFTITISLLPCCCLAVDDTKRADDIEKKKVIADKKQASQKSAKSAKDLEVIQLTSRNFGKNLRDGSLWLVEFYSPQCSHCIEFAPIYADIARHYHGINIDDDTTSAKGRRRRRRKIKVAKVNGQVERALSNRFHIYAYPSFFLIDGWTVYEFNQRRSREIVIKFVDGGYKDHTPVPFYSSPMGPMGLMQGFLVTTGVNLQDLFEYAQQTFGLSPMLVALIVFGSLFLGLFFFLVFLALVIPGQKPKRD